MCEFDAVQTLKFYYVIEILVEVMSVKMKIETYWWILCYVIILFGVSADY